MTSYFLDANKLKKGDIIATFCDRKTSTLVRKVTEGEFSHIMLYCGHGSCIHAEGDGGVHRENIQRIRFNRIDEAAVFRLKEADDRFLDKVITKADSRLGTFYNILDKNYEYCSKLVAVAFMEAGVDLTEDCGRDMKSIIHAMKEYDRNEKKTRSFLSKIIEKLFITPEKLVSSEKLERISNVLREGNESDERICASESATDRQKKIIAKCIKEVNERLLGYGDKVFSINDVFNKVGEHEDYDKIFSSILESNNYFSAMEFEISRHGYRYDFDEMMGKVKEFDKKIELKNFLSQEMNFAKYNRDRFLSDTLYFKEVYSCRPHELFRLELKKCYECYEAFSKMLSIILVFLA